MILQSIVKIHFCVSELKVPFKPFKGFKNSCFFGRYTSNDWLL